MDKKQQDKNKKQSPFLQQKEKKLHWWKKGMERTLQIKGHLQCIFLKTDQKPVIYFGC